MKWIFLRSGVDGMCKLFGVNIFDYDWQDTGETAEVKDPQYKQTFVFAVYSATIKGKNRIFAAGEFSNNVWGFYTLKR